MTLLTYNSKYVIQSATARTTTSSTLVDDPDAIKTDLVLSATQTVLVIYNANSNYSDTGTTTGAQSAIYVGTTGGSGSDYSSMYDSAFGANYPIRNSCVWCGQLSTGTYTVKGRFASNNAGSTVTIHNRTLLIYVFNGDEFSHVPSTSSLTTASTSYIDDSNAVSTFTPSGNAIALILYSACSTPGNTENSNGKKICIKVGSTEYTTFNRSKSPYGSNCSNSMCASYALSLPASQVTVQGRFASNTASTATLKNRTLTVLLFDSSNTTLSSIVGPGAAISSNSNTLVDDTQSQIQYTPTNETELLVIASGNKPHGTSTTGYGLVYGINLDTVDVALSRNSPGGTTLAESVFVAYGSTVTPTLHTIKGRYCVNYGSTSETASTRILIALWFVNPTINISSNVSGSGSTTANDTVLCYLTSNCSNSVGSITANNTLVQSSTPVQISSSVSGSGSITANNSIVQILITSSSSGQGSITATNTLRVSISSTCSGTGSITATNSIVQVPITSTGTGTGFIVANNTILGSIQSTVSGLGSITATNSIVQVPITSSNSGSGSITANIIEIYYISSSGSGTGSTTANITLPGSSSDISSTVSGIGSSTANNSILQVSLSSSNSGLGSYTANITTFLELSSSTSASGTSLASVSILGSIISTVSGSGSVTSVISLYNIINGVGTGIGQSTSSLLILDILSSIVIGQGFTTVQITVPISIIGYSEGFGSELAHILTFSKFTFHHPLTVEITKVDRSLNINQVLRTFQIPLDTRTVEIEENLRTMEVTEISRSASTTKIIRMVTITQ